jgi:hypothetical protein
VTARSRSGGGTGSGERSYVPGADRAAGPYDVRDRAVELAERGVPGATDLAELASRLDHLD